MLAQEALLKRIESTFLARARKVRPEILAGGFAIFLDPQSDLFYLNNAIPVDSPTREGIEEMVQVFKQHGRMPRMEIFRETWPELPSLLEQAGFTLEAEYPMMVCPKENFIPFSSPEVTNQILSPEDDFTQYFAIANEAFDIVILATPEKIEQTKDQIRKGVLCSAVAYVDGKAAASALTTPFDGVCELAGVGTRPSLRRRGAARAVSSALLERHFQTGDLAWLSAGDDAARSLYEKLGFRLAGTQVNYSLKSPLPHFGS